MVIVRIILWICFDHDDAPIDALKRVAPATPAVAVERKAEPVLVAQVKEDVNTDNPTNPTSQLQEQDPAKMQPPMETQTAPAGQKHVDDYLSAHDRDARSLLQAFRVTKHRDYLNEALKGFPDDPIVLLHSVLYDADPTEERKAMLLKLQQLLPDDSVADYLLGEQLLQEGDVGAALELLLAGSLKPHANNYAKEMISDAQEFLKSKGIPSVDALAQATYNQELRLLTPMHNLLSLVQDIQTDTAAKGDKESANTWAIVGSRIAQSMQKQTSLFLIEELVSIGSEKKFPALLPPETELVAGGMTVAQRTEKIEEQLALVRRLTLMGDAALTLPPEEKQLFFKNVQEEGELSALLWLNGRSQ